MTDELDNRIRALHAERARPMPRWNVPTPTDTIQARRHTAERIAQTPTRRP